MGARAEFVMTDLPRLLLELSVLLSIAILVSVFTRRLHIPLTVVLAASGLLVTELGLDLAPLRPLAERDRVSDPLLVVHQRMEQCFG